MEKLKILRRFHECCFEMVEEVRVGFISVALFRNSPSFRAVLGLPGGDKTASAKRNAKTILILVQSQ